MKKLPFVIKLLLAAIFGASLTLAYAPFAFWLVVFIALPGVIYLLNCVEQNQGFKLGFAFGLGWFGAGISWVHVSIAEFGGIPLIASLGLMALLCSYLSLYPALTLYLTRRYFTVHSWPLVMPLLWLASEWLRGWMFTGFPWLSLGYSQLTSPLSGWLPVVGEFGVSGLVVLLSSAITVGVLNKKWLTNTIVIPMVIMLGGFTLDQFQWVTPSGKQAQIAMVQGNIQQEIRWAPEHDQPTMDKYQNMTNNHWSNNDVIIWPEAAIPQLEPVAQDYLLELDTMAATTQTGLIAGIVNYDFDSREAYNNLIGLGLKEAANHDQANFGHYRYNHSNRFSKHHLLPIGEFIPFEDWLRNLAPIFDLPMSSFSRGAFQQHNIQANGFNFAPAICFEIAFPQQISANLYFNTDFIITVSNDAWFGASHGPAQHLEIAQVRAKEFGLAVLRSTNNGITAFINHHGQIQSRLPQFEAAVLSDEIQLVTGTTPYRVAGNIPAWLFSILIFLYALLKKSGNNTNP